MMCKKLTFIIGWLLQENVHEFLFIEIFRSMDGQGNFNWRFVYTFPYFPAERCISIQKKEHFWSFDTTELLIPPILNLQIWDNDKFTPDDFLGKRMFECFERKF